MNITINKRHVIFLSIILMFILLIYLFLFNVSKKAKSYELPADATLSDNIEVFPLQSGDFLILSSSESNSHVSYFDSTTQPKLSDFDLNYKYSSAKVFDNYLYAVECENTNNSYSSTIHKYQISDTSISENSCFTYPFKIENKYSLAAATNNYIFFIDENDRTQFIALDTYNDRSIPLDYNGKQFTSLATNFSGDKVYAITDDRCFISFDLNNSSTPYVLPSDFAENACTFLNDNFFISTTNKVYSINETEVTNIFSIINQSAYRSSCLFGNSYLLGQVSDTLVSCYNLETKTATKQIEFDKTVLALATSNNVTIAILKSSSGKSIEIITESDLEDIVIPPVTTPDEGNSPTTDPSYGISSTEYTINFETKIISNVPLSTTIAVFTSNIENINDYNMSFVNYLGNTFSSGNLGTGSKVSFDIGLSDPLVFKIIVNGDITGEGNKNSRDKDFLYNHLFGKSALLDEYLAAADANADGKVNTIDLLIMDKSFRGF